MIPGWLSAEDAAGLTAAVAVFPLPVIHEGTYRDPGDESKVWIKSSEVVNAPGTLTLGGGRVVQEVGKTPRGNPVYRVKLEQREAYAVTLVDWLDMPATTIVQHDCLASFITQTWEVSETPLTFDVGYGLDGSLEPTWMVNVPGTTRSYVWDYSKWVTGEYLFFVRPRFDTEVLEWVKSEPVSVPCANRRPCNEPQYLSLKYRARFFAPRSADETEESLLTPAANAVHGDEFKVTSVEIYKPTLDGYKPYLSTPEGRNATVDPKTRHTDYGDLTLRLVDHRVEDNSRRWVSAYLGDEIGRSRMRGCRVEVEESFDGGNSWHAYYAGRVMQARVPYATNEGPVYEITIREHRIMEYRNVFVGVPHKNAQDYARPSPLWPIGVTGLPPVPQRPPLLPYSSPEDAWSWNGYALRRALLGEVRETTSSNPNTRLIWFSTTQYDKLDGPTLIPQGRARACTVLFESLDLRDADSDKAVLAGGEICPHARVRVRWRASGTDPYYDMQEGHFWLAPVMWLNGADSKAVGYDGEPTSPLYIYKEDYTAKGYKLSGTVAGFGLRQISTDPNHPLYSPLPPVGAVVDGALIYRAGPPTEKAPIMVDRVHPVRLWEDLNKGYFSELDENGDVITLPIPYQIEEFAVAKQDGSIPSLRFLITKQENQTDFLTNKIFTSVHLASRTNPNGAIGLVDLRLPSVTAIETMPEVGDNDLRDVEWRLYDDIITNLVVKVNMHYGYNTQGYGDVYVEIRTPKDNSDRSVDVPIDVPGCGILTKDMAVSFLSETASDLPLQTHTIDAAGISPVGFGLTGEELERVLWQGENRVEYKALESIANEYLSRFGHGAMILTAKSRRMCFERSSLFGDYGIQPGQWARVRSAHTPNPELNARGGIRLVQVTSRQDTSDGLLELTFIDAGPQTLVDPPTLSNLRLDEDHPSTGVLVDVDMANDNVAESVIIQTAMTDTATHTIPSENSSLWTTRARVYQDTVGVPVGGHNAGSRVWLRARTAGRYGDQLGSEWTYADTYVDMGLIPIHTNLWVAEEEEMDGQGDTHFDPRRLSYWLNATPGDPLLVTEVYRRAGATKPTQWTSADLLMTLPPSASIYEFLRQGEEAEGIHQYYWIAVRHRDARGSVSDYVEILYIDHTQEQYAP